VDLNGIDEDKLMEDTIEVGAVDFNTEEEVFEIFTDPAELSAIRDALEKKGYQFLSAQDEMVPSNYIRLTSEDDLKNINKLLELLEENDDVQNVWHNWDE
jgi:transcriptional/translational regulatory protein YebC/TACO1